MHGVLQVTWYDDSGKRTCNLLRSSSGPSSDIQAAAPMQGYPTLATACYNGEVGEVLSQQCRISVTTSAGGSGRMPLQRGRLTQFQMFPECVQ
jgi:hypothetical protein